MKHIILLCDGMADRPQASLDNKTPMEAARKPAMDSLAQQGEMGLVRTVPPGMPAGSDVANLSVLGCDVAACYTGRSPLEAANIGVELADDDIAIRCNFVTLSDTESYNDAVMSDYCAGDIHTEEARQLIEALQKAFGGGEFDFHTGTAYRHCLVWHTGTDQLNLIPPHDITGQPIAPHLNGHAAAPALLRLMQESRTLLAEHPVNQARIHRGQPPANAIWLWGQGKRPRLESFERCFNRRGAIISAVDLLRGIGRLMDMQVPQVEGATGYIDTNYAGKLAATLAALDDSADFIYLHIEAPDECGHRGEVANKVHAIEDIDRLVLTPLLQELPKRGDFALLVLPDHPTPLDIRTHTADPVPFVLYRSSDAANKAQNVRFTEKTAAETGLLIDPGHTLIQRFMPR